MSAGEFSVRYCSNMGLANEGGAQQRTCFPRQPALRPGAAAGFIKRSAWTGVNPASMLAETALLLPRNPPRRSRTDATGGTETTDSLIRGTAGRIPFAGSFAARPVALLEAR